MKIGYCLTGSFCTFDKAIAQIERIVAAGHTVVPIMSETAYSTDTRFGSADSIRQRLIYATGNQIIHTISMAEPIGPRHMFDVLIVAPCTGNTLAKLANGVVDTTVTMAVKSHLRNSNPVVIGVSTNDALGAAARNIGALLNYRNYYFVPACMDDCDNKPRSMVCDFDQILTTATMAYDGIEQSKKVF